MISKEYWEKFNQTKPDDELKAVIKLESTYSAKLNEIKKTREVLENREN